MLVTPSFVLKTSYHKIAWFAYLLSFELPFVAQPSVEPLATIGFLYSTTGVLYNSSSKRRLLWH